MRVDWIERPHRAILLLVRDSLLNPGALIHKKILLMCFRNQLKGSYRLSHDLSLAAQGIIALQDDSFLGKGRRGALLLFLYF